MQQILLIEDDTLTRDNVSEMLELAGYKVVAADNGKAGIAMSLECNPDLILCDIMMPGFDGYSVLAMVKRTARLQYIPFIFLTGKDDRSEVRKGMEMGADDYITKPFDANELLQAVDCRLKKAALFRSERSKSRETGIWSIENGGGLGELTENRCINTYRKKQLIYKEGHPSSNLYYILKGKVKCYRRNENGREVITRLYREGELLGYIALLENTRYHETAEALEDTELSVIPKFEFDDLIRENPALLKKFIMILAGNIHENEEHLLSTAYHSVRKRVAYVLVFLHNKYNIKGDPDFTIDLSRDNLASIAGVAKESLIRTLSDFKEEKLIGLQDNKIQLFNYVQLNSMCD